MSELALRDGPADAPRTLGRYRLVSHLAAGGMGDVHLARLAGPAGFQRWVVVKVLLPELAPSPRYRDMFLAEARLAARLQHPNACEVLDLGEERGTYYIVMPYLDGVPLAALMTRPDGADARWYERLVTGVIAQACEGLHHAHELRGDDGTPLGVVHRDVSPSNVMVLRDGVVKVVDFGIAKSRASGDVTEKDVIKGKPAYMAPEQLAGGAIDRRADLFCVGILLWEALAQRPLFQRASHILSARAVLEEAPPAEGLAGVSPALAEVVVKALAKEPYKRFATADELRRALVAVAGGVMGAGEIAEAVKTHWSDRLRPPPVMTAEPATVAGSLSQAETVARAVTTGRRARGWAAIAGAAVVVATAVVVAIAVGSAREPEAPVMTAAAGSAAAAGAGADAAAAAAAGTAAAAAADAATAADTAAAAETAAAPARRASPRRERPPAVAREPGTLSIDSSPWATIYIDGKRVGLTPLIDRRLSAGVHHIKAVAEDGREQTHDVEIRAGAAHPPLRLHW